MTLYNIFDIYEGIEVGLNRDNVTVMNLGKVIDCRTYYMTLAGIILLKRRMYV